MAKSLKPERRLFRSLKEQTDLALGIPPEAILRYERQFRRDFRAVLTRPLRSLTRRELRRRMREADVTLVADFHTFAEAQKTALRLLEGSFCPGETWYLGLEMVPSSFQRVLDAYQAGKLSLEAFLGAIQYRKQWGFPWENYAPLFRWARRHRVRLIALNRPGSRDLVSRDRWAARIIRELLAKQPASSKKSRPRMLVLYGELHVATAHLPRELRARGVRPLSVHQNYDPLYWRVVADPKLSRTGIVELRSDAVCVFSSTPWAKMESLLSWIEELEGELI